MSEKPDPVEDQESPEEGEQAEETPKEEVVEEISWKNEYLYLRADFDNYKKQAIKERSELIKYGSERLAKDLLEVLDNFDRALSTELSAQTMEEYKKGVELTAKSLQGLLKKHGVEEIPSLQVAFDPSIHEALSSQETDQVEPGHIMEVYKKAYKLHEKVIRPAQVVVAKANSN